MEVKEGIFAATKFNRIMALFLFFSLYTIYMLSVGASVSFGHSSSLYINWPQICLNSFKPCFSSTITFTKREIIYQLSVAFFDRLTGTTQLFPLYLFLWKLEKIVNDLYANLSPFWQKNVDCTWPRFDLVLQISIFYPSAILYILWNKTFNPYSRQKT
jgi:hypothetical protein